MQIIEEKNNEEKIIKENKTRITYIDIAKGIAILCIILGHIGIVPINEVVYSFHVPIFFIISGYFTKVKKNTELIKSMIKTLILPYIVTCFIILINTIVKLVLIGDFSNILPTTSKIVLESLYGSGVSISYFFNIGPIGAIWFLLALFWARLLFNLIINRKEKLIYIITFFVIGYISAKYIWLPLSLQSGLVALLFVYLGYLMKKYDLFSKLNIINIVILFLIWLCIISFSSFYYDHNLMTIVNCRFNSIPLDLIGAISGSLVVIGISKYIENIKSISKLLQFFGKNSLIVLCFHLIELNTIPFIRIVFSISKNKNIIIILTYCIKVLWAAFGIYVCKNVKILGKLFNYKLNS